MLEIMMITFWDFLTMAQIGLMVGKGDDDKVRFTVDM